MMIQQHRLMNKFNKWLKDIDYRVILSNECFRLDLISLKFHRIFSLQDLLTESTVIDYLRKRITQTDSTTVNHFILSRV